MPVLNYFGLQEIVIILIMLLFFIVPVITLIDVLKNESEGNNKLIWVLVILLLPVFGAIIYFIIGNRQKIRRY